MSGAADDDSAPSNSTPQSPEGAEGAPDVTVTASKPDTPGSQVEDDGTSRNESKNETPTDQPAKEENVEPAKDENATPNDQGKTDKGDGTADVEEPEPADGEGAQNASEESPATVEEERIGEPAPVTGETEPAKQDDANPLGEGNEAPPSESENGETGESKQPDEPTKEAGETEGIAVTGGSTKEEEKPDEDGTVDKTNSGNDVNENGATENANINDNNDAAEGTAPNPEVEAPTDITESDTREIKSNEGDIAPEIKDPVVDASNTTSVANEDAPSGSVEDKQRESAPSNNPDDGTPIINTNDGGDSSKHEEAAEHTNVEMTELDSLKLENERLGKKVNELEDEIDRIREGRKEGMKVQADYLARELNQQQDTEKYLREKLAEVLQEKEESERRVKDHQLRLKRFAKDDQAKDARLSKMEKELQDVTHEVQILENMLDEDTLRTVQERRASGKVNGPSGAGTGRNKGTTEPPPPQSKTCVIL